MKASIARHHRAPRGGMALAATLAMLLPLVAWADDSSEGATPGIFSASPWGSVSFARADIRIDGRQVVVTFAPRVSTTTGSARLVLEGETFGWLGESEAYPDRHFPELQFTLDGRPVQPLESFVALVGETDVSALLAQAHIDPWLIAETPPLVPVEGIAPSLLDKLLRAGALRRTEEGYLAGWRARRHLEIPLAASGRTLALHYTARPAFALDTIAEVLGDAALSERYCVNAMHLWPTIPDSKTQSPVQYQAQWNALLIEVEGYSIPVAVDGRAPDTVRVSMRPSIPVRALAGCRWEYASLAPLTRLQETPVSVGAQGKVDILSLRDPASIEHGER